VEPRPLQSGDADAPAAPVTIIKKPLFRPELFSGQPRPFRHRLKLCPGNCWMAYPGADAAVRAGDDIFSAYPFGEIHLAVGDRLRVFNKVAVVAGNAGDQNFSLGEFSFLPDAPLVFMAGIRRLDGIGAGVNLQDDIDNVA
jgi:hypothetical protein